MIKRDIDGDRFIAAGEFALYPAGGGWWHMLASGELLYAWINAKQMRALLREEMRK